MDFSKMMRGRLPGDTTLAEARRWFELDPETERVQVLTPRLIRVRFVRTSDEKDLPDSMTLDQFRMLANLEQARIVIDDPQGGTPARLKTPELVL